MSAVVASIVSYLTRSTKYLALWLFNDERGIFFRELSDEWLSVSKDYGGVCKTVHHKSLLPASSTSHWRVSQLEQNQGVLLF